MKKPVVDYREFRFSKLNDPKFRHLKLLGCWIGYFSLYFLTENLIPVSACHEVHCVLDDMIPFTEQFVIFYYSWYLLCVLSLLYYLLYDVPRFRQLQIFIGITQAVAMFVYIVYPTIQLLRPAVMPRDNFFTRVIGFLYAFDTPTGVSPSLHVAYTIGILSVFFKDPGISKKVKVALLIWGVLICLSTAFIKQHSVVDIFTALPLGLLAEILVFGRSYYLPKIREKKA